MMLEVIKKVYDEMIFTICMGIDDNDLPVIKEKYKKLLNDRYSNSDVRMKLNDYDKIYKIIYNIEYKEWVDRSPSIKKGMLLRDSALEKIIDMSNIAFNLAMKKYEEGNITSVDYANVQIIEMEKLLEQVSEENKFNAEKYISEGTVDFLFASGQSDAMSLRMGRFPQKR